MRILLFFFFLIETAEDKRNYRQFRRVLVKNGFIMLQKSVYCKLMTTPSVERSVKKLINDNKPPDGLVQILTVTEKQFAGMEFIVGKSMSDIVDSDERTVIL